VKPLPDGARHRTLALRSALLELHAFFDIVVTTPPKIYKYTDRCVCYTDTAWPVPLGRKSVRTNIVLDDDLIAEGLTLTGIPSRRQLVDTALRELIRNRKKKNLADLAGQIQFYDGFDPKALREGRGDFGR